MDRSIEAGLTMLVPYFAEHTSLDEGTKILGNFLSTQMSLDAFVMVRLAKTKDCVGQWCLPASQPYCAHLADRTEKKMNEIVACADKEGLVSHELLVPYYEIEIAYHLLGIIIYDDHQVSGCMILAKQDSEWTKEEIEFLKIVRNLTAHVYAMHLNIENDNRNNFIFDTVLDRMRSSIYITDPETNRILFMNQSMKDDFDVTHPEGKLCFEVLQKGKKERCSFCPIHRLMQTKDTTEVIQWDELNTVTGRSYRNYDSLMTWLDGSLVHLQHSLDITDLKTANTDELTQLLSRRPGKIELQKTMDQAKREKNVVTVCFYDVNNLKFINDRFGNAQGDRVITAITQAIQDVLKDDEYAFRMSGDEFVVVFLADEKEAKERIKLARQQLSQLDSSLQDSFCYGMVEVTPDHNISAEDVLFLADERMYEQKRRYHIMKNEERLSQVRSELASKSFQYDEHYLYDALAKSTEDYPFVCNMKTGIFRYAPTMVEEFNLPQEVIENAAAVWGAKVHESDKAAFLEANQEITDGRALSHCVEYRALNRRNEWVWVRCRGQVELDDNNEPTIFAGFISKLDKKNNIDRLTGLFNKVEFEEYIRSHIASFQNTPLGIIMLGLDDLKHINDLYDREFGDVVIRMTSQRLNAMLPFHSKLYRLDGDEFGIVVENSTKEQLLELCHKINYSFEVQQEVDGKKFYCTLSGGTVLYPQDANHYLDLVKYAGYCLSYAKRHGKNCCIAYSSGILDHRSRSLEMAEDLRTSMMDGFEGFRLHYQPLVDARTGKVVGAEALLRWSCPRFEKASPAEFIPILEQTGMIIPVGRWILNSAIRQCASWVKKNPNFVLNVNLSYLQIQGEELVPYVLRLLEENNLPSKNLVLELTESHFVQDNQHVQEIFGQLREKGVKIAVDDFGTGFSSLSILKEIPADVVKIDKTFIKDIRTSSFDAMFIRFVVALCHDVGIAVCLEGVEVQEEYDIVNPMGLNMIQGFFFGKPVASHEFETKYLDI